MADPILDLVNTKTQEVIRILSSELSIAFDELLDLCGNGLEDHQLLADFSAYLFYYACRGENYGEVFTVDSELACMLGLIFEIWILKEQINPEEPPEVDIEALKKFRDFFLQGEFLIR